MGRNSSESQQLWCGALHCCGLEREVGGTAKECERSVEELKSDGRGSASAYSHFASLV